MTNCFRELHIYRSYYYFRVVSINNSEPGTSHFVKVSAFTNATVSNDFNIENSGLPIGPSRFMVITINMYSRGRHLNHR